MSSAGTLHADIIHSFFIRINNLCICASYVTVIIFIYIAFKQLCCIISY